MEKKTFVPHAAEWFSADKPIESRKDDALGRRGFSEALAGAIQRWTGRESLVIALYGPWGTGKSSIKNMVIDCLSSEAPQLLTVDFNPWQFAVRPSLSEAFFDELGVVIGRGDLGTNSVRKSVLARYRRWAHRLLGGRDLVKAASTFFGATLVGLGTITITAAWSRSFWVTAIFGALTLVTGVLALVSRFVEAAIKFIEAGTEVGARTINEVKKELSRDLKKLKTPILIVLDDLDRLTPQETLEVFQLIKANADFPNLIYLLLCERAIVEGHIEKAVDVSGRDYLEKIVQVAFDVPIIDSARVHRVLFARLDLLLGTENAAARFSNKRWANVFMSGMRSYFETLRDVNRFASTLAFQFAALSADGALEVNPIDLIALEVLRMFEPDVYAAIRSSKDLLTNSGKEDKSATEKSVASIVELSSPSRKEDVKGLIKHLFPPVEWTLGGTRYADEFGQEWYQDLRVCSRKMFDRYFRLAVSDEELSQGAIQRLSRARGNRADLSSELEDLNTRGLLALAIEELALRYKDLQSNQIEPFITAIFDVADNLSDEMRGSFEVPMLWRIGFLINGAVEQLPSSDIRLETLSHAITNTKGLFMPVDFVVLIEPSEKSKIDLPLLPESHLAKLKDVAVQKLENASSSGALAQHPKLAVLLSLWLRWGKKEAVQTYISTLTKDAEGTLLLLRSLVVRSVSRGLEDYIGTERYYMRRIDIEILIPMDILNAEVQKLGAQGLDDEDRRAVTAFNKAMERRAAGKLDDDPFARD